MKTQNLLIVQGGGPTTVFNTTLAAILSECAAQSTFSSVYGARWGMAGLCSGNLIRLDELSEERIHALAHSPGAALGSSRFKPSEDDLLRACETLRKLDIQCMIFIGGNGTIRGAEIFRAFCRAHGLELQIIGVPKTIDNDIHATDRCPGFGSAARYVAQSTIDLTMDIRSLPQPVSIFETLGRDVGWIAASSTLAKRDINDAPHVVCVPEVPFDRDDFLLRIEASVRRIGWAVAVISEGTRYADGTPLFQQEMPPTAGKPNRPLIGGIAQYLSGVVTEHTGLRCRSEKPGLIGRSAMAYVSRQDRADAEVAGREGVRAILRGETDQMVSLLPLGEAEGNACGLVPFSRVAIGSRELPKEWLSNDGLAVNEACRAYMRRIAGELQFYPVL